MQSHTRRYRLENNDIFDQKDFESVVEGQDKKSKKPVLLRVLRQECLYESEVDKFINLRSMHVANLLDHWKDEERHQYVLVIGRAWVYNHG